MLTCCLLYCFALLEAQVPQPVKHLLKEPYMRGATLSLVVKDVADGEILYAWQPDLEVTPASVMKLVTTSAALESLGEDFRFKTTLEYDGVITDSTLNGNLYIRGSGDPTLGSRHPDTVRPLTAFASSWHDALRNAGIRCINGNIIADEGCFDTEGISLKWVAEDLGSSYGAGSYGINVFDNNYTLQLRTGASGTRPQVTGTEPELIRGQLTFHNYLTARPVAKDSSYVLGAPFSPNRYLYGVIPSNRDTYQLKGDIPDPALFLSNFFAKYIGSDIDVKGKPLTRRILTEEGKWEDTERVVLHTWYATELKEVVRITNHVSQNLYADVLFKTFGNTYQSRPGEILSSFGKGTAAVTSFWNDKGLDVSSLVMFDGSGLAVTNKVTARFLTDLLVYMQTEAVASDAFYNSLPLAGAGGSVRNFLKGTPLQGKLRLKSGSMSRVKSYAGYVDQKGKRYAIALFINNYSCDGRDMNRAIERLLLALFS